MRERRAQACKKLRCATPTANPFGVPSLDADVCRSISAMGSIGVREHSAAGRGLLLVVLDECSEVFEDVAPDRFAELQTDEVANVERPFGCEKGYA